MINKMSSRQQGFTIIELVISLGIFLLVLLAVYQLFDTGSSTYRRGQRRADVQQNARVALDEAVRQIRMTQYFPENYDGSAVNDLPAGSIGLHVATSDGLAVYGDLDGSCTLNPLNSGTCPANSSSVFLYCVDKDKPNRKVYIRRGKGLPTAVASYTCSSGEILAVLADLTYRRDSDSIIDGTTWLTFTYYNANNALIPVPATAPKGLDGQVLGTGALPSFADTTNRGQVRTVVVTLTAREDTPRENPQIYSLTSSIRLRNVN